MGALARARLGIGIARTLAASWRHRLPGRLIGIQMEYVVVNHFRIS
jgi:hypothetical protein